MNKRIIVEDEIKSVYKVCETDVTVITKKYRKSYKNRRNKDKVDVSYGKFIYVDF
tara:strand:+ start:270 stop:434 length:165 start_codon:yes stop_codon:yes gene_type:complete